ncbi:glycosyltransferase [Agrobacterium larrymoorei]|nr:glycosyltransferase [Agrobacterium larrymoorei]
MSDRPKVVLATDSRNPSGMGEHMLTLGQALATDFDITIALIATDDDKVLSRAARLGLKIRLAKDTAHFQSWFSNEPFDLLHVHAGIGWEGHGLVAAGFAADIPVIRTEHLPYLLTDPEQRRSYGVEASRVSHHIVVSEASYASYAPHLPPERLSTIKNGIYPLKAGGKTDVLRRNLKLEDRIVLLNVARFSAQKDHATLLRALEEVVKTHPATTLLLVGTGEERPNIEAMATACRLDENIHFLGRRSDIAELMSMVDLFVLPSRFEGLPLVALEAMSLGLPIIATRVSGTLEALGSDHRFFADAGDHISLAKTIIYAIDHRQEAEASALLAQKRFQHEFTAQRMASETADIYRRFIAAPARNSQKDQSMQKTRLAFIGTGGIAQRHLDILAGFEEVELVGFADPDTGRADQAAMRFGAKSFAHHREMLDSVKPDAVYVCIPPFAHGDAERDLIERGIPFFVEKPVSVDLQTAEEIAKAVTDKGLITAVGYHWRYLDTVDEARYLLAENPPQLMSGYWLDSTPPPQWWWKKDKSGGQMVEQATHLLDLTRFLVGEVTEVYGRASHKDRHDFPDLDVSTTSTANLTFENGVVANIASTCLLGWSHRVGLHVFAENLAIELTDREIMVDVGRGRPVRGANGDPVWREDRDLIDAVRGGENRIRCPYSEALQTHRLALAVEKSIQEGRPVQLDPPDTPRPELAPLRFQPQPDEPRGLPEGHRIIRSLGIEAEKRPYFFEYEEGPPADGLIRLDTLYTGLSAGTELTFMKNTNPYFQSRFDGERGVFAGNEPDLHYPVPFLGYMEVARISESRAQGYSEGSIVASTYAHKTGHTADPYHDLLIKLPETLDPILGIFVAQMGPIAANGILHADAEAFGPHVSGLGASIRDRPAMIIGAGTVGLMTALFARHLGASEVVIADPSEFRRQKAEAMGLTAMTEDHAWQHAKARWHDGAMGRGADVVFQTRAHSDSLHTAMKALRAQGTVIDLAFYQGGADRLRLGEEFHHNGLNLRCAQINRVPRGLAALWDRRRLALSTVELLIHEQRAILDHMITHVVPIDDALVFLINLVENRPEFLQVVFKVSE